MKNISEIKKIDIHAHVAAFPDYYPPSSIRTRFVSPEELLEFYDRLGIEKGVLLPISSPEGQASPMTSEACKWVSQKYPDRFYWFCNVDPRAGTNRTDSDLTSILEFYKNLGAKGVGEVTANIYFDDERAQNLFACCEKVGMPVLFHIAPTFEHYGLVDDLGLPRLEKMLKKFPKLKFIGHSQPFWSEMSADVTEELRNSFPETKVIEGRVTELMRKYDNLYCDFSANSGSNALMRDREYAAKFIEEFSDRIFYGCDICAPSNTHPYPFKEFIEDMYEKGEISEENYIKLVRENAINVLGLGK